MHTSLAHRPSSTALKGTPRAHTYTSLFEQSLVSGRAMQPRRRKKRTRPESSASDRMLGRRYCCLRVFCVPAQCRHALRVPLLSSRTHRGRYVHIHGSAFFAVQKVHGIPLKYTVHSWCSGITVWIRSQPPILAVDEGGGYIQPPILCGHGQELFTSMTRRQKHFPKLVRGQFWPTPQLLSRAAPRVRRRPADRQMYVL